MFLFLKPTMRPQTSGTSKRVFLATQFLRNMTVNPIPLIAEAVDLYNTLRLGVSGIQLSEETAIGRYPEECVEFVMKMHALAEAAAGSPGT